MRLSARSGILRPMRSLALSLALIALSCTPVDPPCQPTRRPLVAVHGFLASGDTWAPHAQRFASNGQCFERVQAYDWNTLGSSDEALAGLERFVDEVRARTGFDQVDLAGHSAGGGLGYTYLSDPARAAKVAHYVHVASFKKDGPAGPADAPVATLNLWSEADFAVRDHGDIPGATNVKLDGADHYAVATSEASFRAIASFLDGEANASAAITTQEAARLSGKALVLGTNEPVAGGTVDLYELDADGQRDGEPVASFTTAADGRWGPFNGVSGTRYEFVVRAAGPDAVPVHYYREPFTRSNDLVHLRTLPPPNTLAGALLSGLRYDDDHSIVIVFLASHALLAGRDTLTVDGRAIPLEKLAAPEKTAIALFLDDGNANGESDLTPLEGLSGFPFLGGADVMIPASTPSTVSIRLNDRELRLRNWRSASEGPVVAVFE